MAPKKPASAQTDDGLMIVESVSFTEHGSFHLDSGALDEGTRDLRVGRRIVVMAADAAADVITAWQSHGWTVVLRDPACPIYKMPEVAEAIAASPRVVLAANLANLIGAVPALRQLNKKVVAILREAQPIPARLFAMLASTRSLPEATFRLPAAIGHRAD